MATKEELEKKVTALETQITESQEAIRNLASQNEMLIKSCSELTADVAMLKGSMTQIRTRLGSVPNYAAGISR